MKKKYIFLAVALSFSVIFFASRYYKDALVSVLNFGTPASQVNLNNLIEKGLIFKTDGYTKNLNYLSAQKDSITLKKKVKGTAAASAFLKEYGNYFGLKTASDAKLIATAVDNLGLTHLRYLQAYKGVPVFGGAMIIHLNKDKAVKSANGKIWQISGVTSTKANIKTARLRALTSQYWQQKFGVAPSSDLKLSQKLYIFNHAIFNPNAEDKSYLTWQVAAFDPVSHQKEYFFIDAKSGRLIYKLTASKTDIDRSVYNCYGQDESCWLNNDDNKNDKGRAEGDAAVQNNHVNRIYDYLNIAHRYFEAKFRLNGANQHGGVGDGSDQYPVPGTTAWAEYVPPATADWSCPNAMWDGAASFIICPDRDYLQIIGHEYTHAVTDFNLNNGPFIYESESGAISEAISDIFGFAVERRGTGSTNWVMSAGAHVIRDVTNPTNSDDPNTFYSPKFGCETPCDVDHDFCNVHTNSTVVSHAAYLMAHGGSFNGCSISKIGEDKVEEIFYRAVTTYLFGSAGFNDLYYAVNDSCADLYGANSTDCRQVGKAMQAAELDQSGGRCSTIPEDINVICGAPFIKDITSLSENKTYKTGDFVNVLVHFSKPVVSDAVNIWLDTGNTGACPIIGLAGCGVSCSFPMDGSSEYGYCNYTVKDDDYSADLNVARVSGSITDLDGLALANYTPITNLAENKDIVVDARVTKLKNPANLPDEVGQNLPNINTGIDIDLPDEVTNPNINIPINLNQNDLSDTPAPTDQTSNQQTQNTQQTQTTVKPDSGSNVTDRSPVMELKVWSEGTVFKVEGEIKSFGPTEKCAGPRYFNPVVINWTESGSTPSIKDGKFYDSHDYKNARNPSEDVTIKVTNSCFAMTLKRYRVTISLNGLDIILLPDKI